MSKKNFRDKLRKVKQFKIDKNNDIDDIIHSLENTGFNAKRLAKGCEIYAQMIADTKCTKFFGLAGAMVPVGMQGLIYQFIEEGFLDILVTTGANLTHDIAETLGYHHLQGEMDLNQVDDVELHENEMNRIYDVFLPNNVYEGIEDFISELEIPDYNMPVSSFLKYLGKQLPQDSQSILKIAAEKNVPIFCPAFTDSGLALQLGFHFQKLNLNHFKDMLRMVDLAWDSKNAGVCIVGGGVPKNFIFQSLQFCPTSAKYAIQITMDRPEPGGLSGATLSEAMSWGKVNKDAKHSMIISDATIALPIILWYLKTRV
ncbi:MAG: deoxyhypusine synthase [Candidatus Lokiarchaeota archaeon]|nr:deoxyhypusine synthase [Candidatus Lokiarchaeota archaeon]MBD3198442.1 deoxyhypusine synthase [Candidatus Lokiarchaeota archaeon]